MEDWLVADEYRNWALVGEGPGICIDMMYEDLTTLYHVDHEDRIGRLLVEIRFLEGPVGASWTI